MESLAASPSSSLPKLLLLLLLLISSPTSSSAKTFPGDAAALEALKLAVEPSSIPAGSCLSTWDFSGDPCDSASGQTFTCGFLCDDTAGELRHVTEITLDSAGYSGTLSAAVWTISSLQALDLPGNRFSGQIPPPITGLPPLLRRLTLSRNSFSGDLPTLHPAPSLEELYLDGNLLSGAVPPSLASLRSLRRLEIQSNSLSGELPRDLTALIQLQFLDASNNSISGELPPLPASLVEVTMRDNKLSGALPESALSSLPLLQVLDLADNGLWGAVPAAAFEHPALQQLVLAGNRFDGIESPSGAAWSRLVAVDLGRNRISGGLPWFLAAMPDLAALSLEHNQFSGEIPAAFAARAVAAAATGGGLVPFGRLLLAGNYLTGPVPVVLLVMAGDGAAALVSLADNCIFRCPERFPCCRGGRQKPPEACRLVVAAAGDPVVVP